METSPLPVKDCLFDLCSALMVIEQLGFLSVAQLLWNGTSVYNGHLRGCRAFIRGAVTTFWTTYVCRGCDSNTKPSARLLFLKMCIIRFCFFFNCIASRLRIYFFILRRHQMLFKDCKKSFARRSRPLNGQTAQWGGNKYYRVCIA